MKKFLHIGYPKNFSTSLQRSFFSNHPEIYNLGIGVGNNIGYADDEINSAFEVYLKTAKSFKYQENKDKLKEAFNKHFQLAEQQDFKAFGASSEHLSFSFTYDSLDFQTKFCRTKELMGDDLHVIMVVREQMSLIKSLYRESIRVGYSGTFQDYLYALYKFQDRNYFYDFRYDLVYEFLKDEIPESNIHVLFFEDYREIETKSLRRNEKNEVKLISDLSNVLGVNYPDTEFDHHNEAISYDSLIHKLELNKSISHDLGNNLYSSAEIHRQATYFLSELNLHEDEKTLFKDVLTKRKLIKKANSLSAESDSKYSSKEFWKCDTSLYSKINSFYSLGNENFEKLVGKPLPSNYYAK